MALQVCHGRIFGHCHLYILHWTRYIFCLNGSVTPNEESVSSTSADYVAEDLYVPCTDFHNAATKTDEERTVGYI
jgi:hypothetical protein